MKSFIMSSLRRALTAALFLSLFAALCVAQSTTDGAVGGTVYDLHDAVVPNAQIVVHNNGTNIEQTATSDAAGFYRVQKLQPGSYTVTVKAEGFAAFKSEQVIVQVGSFTELAPHLNIAGSADVIDVSAAAPQIDYNSPDFAATLNSTAIENLPINGGRWSNFAILTPTVVSDSSGFGLLSFRGQSTLLNNNTVDGADNNQAFFSEERGRTRAGYSSAKASVQEFQVNTSNYSAEYGRSAGGVVNTVTKSGTNTIHGEAYFYDRDNDFGALNPYAVIATQTSPGVFTTVPYNPKDWRKMWGLGVGGPVIKDKLFWFFAYDQYKRNFPGTAVPSNPNAFFAPPNATTINTLAAHLGVSTAVATTDYNNGLAGLNTMLGTVPRTGDQTIFFPKLDWEINQKNHLSLSVNRMRWSSPAGIQTQGTNTFGTNSFGNDFVQDTWGVIKLDTFITNTISNEARVQYGRDFEFEFSQKPSQYEQNTLVTPAGYTNPLGLPPQISITNGFTFGVPTFLQRAAFPDEYREQYADTLTVTHGNHTFKFGADISHVDDNAKNLRTQYGSYSYSSLLNYFSDLYKPNSCAGPCYNSYQQAFGPLGFDFATNDLGFFVQDDWKVIPRLTLSFGLRYEYEMMPNAFKNLINPAVPQTSNLPNDQNNLGPRFGFAYDPFGKGKTVIRGGYGLYYGRAINSAVYNALTSTGMPGSQFSYSFTPASIGAPAFPKIIGTQPSTLVKPNIVYFDPNFQLPAIHQIDLSIERDLGWGTVLSLSYLGSIGRSLPDFVDQNVAPSTKNITYTVVNGGPLTTPTYTTALFNARLNPNYAAMTDIFSGVHSNYNAFVIQVNHRMSHNIQFSANYTWSHSIDYGVNGATFTDTNDLFNAYNLKAEKSNGIFNVPNRFVISAIATSPWHLNGWAGYLTNDWEFAPIFQIQNGLPYNLLTSGNAPGGIAGAAGSVNGSGGTNRIDTLGRNSFTTPMTWVPDVRLSKRFAIRENYKLELATDFFNLANHPNVTSVNTTGYFVATNPVATPTGTVTCSAAAPCLNYNVSSSFAPLFSTTTAANSNFVYSPRQIQLSARFEF